MYKIVKKINEEINSLKSGASMCDVNGDDIMDGEKTINKVFCGS